MRKILLGTAAVLLFPFGKPVSAQFFGADPAAIAAQTYCAARAQGLDNARASRMANGSMAAAGDFATLIVHANNINTRKEYLAKQMCPEYFGVAPGSSSDWRQKPGAESLGH